MNQLRCEMCGGIDLVKQDGVYVCQNCGMKYSVEDAKRMMIEGTVDVKGTVKVDNTSFVEKYLANARRAMQKKDWEEAEKYYNLVEQNDPANIEAIFYSAYGKARMSMVDADIFKRQQICDVFCNSISVIDDNYDVNKSEENRKIISQMSNDLFAMFNGSFVFNEKTDSYGIKEDDKNKTYFLFAKMSIAFCDSLTNITKIDDNLDYLKLIYAHKKYLVSNLTLKADSRKIHCAKANELGQLIHEKDPSFHHEEIKFRGCYVATAVYGSYDCPQVWTLRRFRDYTLAETWYGRSFVYTYYAISPTLVKWFGETEWFKRLWRGILDKMVSRLQKDGVEATPYQDREW